MVAVPAPSFGNESIANQRYALDAAIPALQLPEATGGLGALTYSISPALPDGLSFNAATRRVTGRPNVAQNAAAYTYTATDEGRREASLTFTIAVAVIDLEPRFGSETVADQTYTQNSAIAELQLPVATGGNGRLAYSIWPALPGGLTFDSATLRVTGTPEAPQDATTYTYLATDADGDTDSLAFTITVEPDPDAPTAPTLRVVASSDWASLSWSAGSGQTTGWQYAWSTSPSSVGTWAEVPGSHAGTKYHTITDLSIGQTYYFWVRGVNGDLAGAGIQPGVGDAARRQQWWRRRRWSGASIAAAHRDADAGAGTHGHTRAGTDGDARAHRDDGAHGDTDAGADGHASAGADGHAHAGTDGHADAGTDGGPRPRRPCRSPRPRLSPSPPQSRWPRRRRRRRNPRQRRRRRPQRRPPRPRTPRRPLRQATVCQAR